MKLNRKELLAALNLCAKMPRIGKNSLPIFDAIMVENTQTDQEPQMLRLTFSSLLGMRLVQYIPCEGFMLSEDIRKGHVDACCLPFKLLRETVNNMWEEEVELIATGDLLNPVRVVGMYGEVSIPTLGTPAAYPEFKYCSPTNQFLDLTHTQLERFLKQGGKYTADDALRPVMNGMYLYAKGDEVGAVTTDAHKLYHGSEKRGQPNWKEQKSTFPLPAADWGYILPSHSFALVLEILKRGSHIMTSFGREEKGNGYFRFAAKNITLYVREIEGNYPNYAAVFPQSFKMEWTVNRLDMLRAIKLLRVTENKHTNLLRCHTKAVSDNERDCKVLVMETEDRDFELKGRQEIDVEKSGDETEHGIGTLIGFKSEFLEELLKGITTQKVRIRISDSTKAAVILPEDDAQGYRMLLMPMMVDSSYFDKK